MKWLYRLDYKYGRYYIRSLMTVVVAGMAAVYFLDMFAGAASVSVSGWLSLSVPAVLRGQVWRLVTFLFVPEGGGSFLLLITLYFYFMMGRLLENTWGGFRLNIYYLLGFLGTVAGSFAAHFLLAAVTGQSFGVTGSNFYLNQSLFFAFATLAPDTRFSLFFFIPIKAKWIALFGAAMIAVDLFTAFMRGGLLSGAVSLIMLAFSLINYLIFFAPSLAAALREQARIIQNRRTWRNKNNWR